VDYEAWEALATRAEDAVAAARASNEAFESLRSQVAASRDRFLRAQDINKARIETLRSQIAALGPVPAEGEAEAEEIAVRRATLQEQLSTAQAPVLRAVEAFNRADGIIGEIDAIIRDRQTDELLELGPSPLLPNNWLSAAIELDRAGRLIVTETVEAWASDVRQGELRDALPKVIFFTIAALVLLLRGRAISLALNAASQEYLPRQAYRLARVLWSLAEVALPVLGLYLAVAAIEATAMLGLRGTAILGAVPTVGLFLFGAHWLGWRLFGSEHYIALPEAKRGALRRSVTVLGLLYGLSAILEALTKFDSLSPATIAVLYFPFAVLAGLALVRLGQVMIRATRAEPDAEVQVFGMRWLNYAGRLTILFALAGMVLVGIGYLQAGLFLLLPTIGTLALLGFLFVIDDLMREIYGLVVGAEDESVRLALIPTLLSLLLAIASLPFFALIWGARTADLLELWSQFREGFTVGDAKISPEAFLTFVLIFVVLFLATRMVQGALRSNVLPKTAIDKGGQTAIVSGVGYVGIFLAAVIAITTAGIDLSSIALVAGALSVGIGFGLQNIVQNFVSGIILLIERPVAEGDWVQVGGTTGIVKKISVRSTLIETFDRVDVIVPNGDFIASQVQNWTRTNNIGRIIVTVGVAYGTDTRRVHDILNEIAQEHPLVTVDPAPGVDFLGFGADSLDFRIRAVLSDVNFSLSVKNEIHHRIAERFAEEGIEIPFAQRDIWLRNPEALRAPPPAMVPTAMDELEDFSDSMGDAAAELTPDQIGDADGETV
jgi:small-conductance mechanosensitive channel